MANHNRKKLFDIFRTKKIVKDSIRVTLLGANYVI
jgi:hypothetical protein